MEYFENPLMPGKPMFRCDRLAATLKVESCASMWREANAYGVSERLFRCRGCPIGASHAGAKDPSSHWLRGSMACSRCHRTDMRLVGKLLCISCYNRQREYVAGSNAKGKPPSRHPKLSPVRLKVFCGQSSSTLSSELATGVLELVVCALRDMDSKPYFSCSPTGIIKR